MKYQRRSILIAVAIFSVIAIPSQAALTHGRKVTLTVFAASSLGQTFSTIGKAFEKRNPGVSVQFSFLASSTLVTQLKADAPADVFASASVSDMDLVRNLISDVVPFAAANGSGRDRLGLAAI